MTTESAAAHRFASPKRQFILLTIFWSICLVLTMVYEMKQTKLNTLEMARLQAKVARAKDRFYRNWVVSKGGVYAEVSPQTTPNPYLDVPNRDLVCSSNKQLTLINPAYMFRQVHEMEREEKGLQTHVTSLDLIRPENEPDQWERKALEAFQRGEGEVYSLETIEGKQFMRFMSPTFIKKGCLKCHGWQDYEIDDLRGGISVSVPMAPLLVLERKRLIQSFLLHFCLWLMGVGGLFFGFKRVSAQQQKRQEIEESLQSFKETLDKVTDCVFMFSSDDYQFFYVNQGASEQVGYSEEELLQMTPIDIKPLFNEKQFSEITAPLVEQPGVPVIFETIHRHKEGRDIPVEVQLQFVQPKNRSGRFVAVVRDITNRKKAEAEKERLQSQMLHSQKLESVGQLAAGIAHEINTPAQFLGSNMDFLTEAFQDVESLITEYNVLVTAVHNNEVDEDLLTHLKDTIDDLDWEYLAEEIPVCIEQSRDGIQRISKIVRAMKEFSHPGSKEKAPEYINNIINTTLTVASNEWKYVADIELDLAEDLPAVSCLSDEMGQVFLNIIVNAAHAIAKQLGEDKSDEKGKIHISSTRGDTWVEVTIRDNGCGMSESTRSHIFEPFFTTKEVGKGTGQGLAIAHDVIVSKHQGTLSCESKEGIGTSFIVRIPIG